MYNMLRNLIKRAFQSAVLEDTGNFSVGQASYYGKASQYEQVYPYGYSANAPRETLILLFDSGGREQDLAGIPYGSKNRFKNLKAGEVELGNFLKRTSIKFDEDGNIIITAPDENITINSAKSVNITAQTEINITAEADINITSTGETTLTASQLTIENDTTINGNLIVNGEITDTTGKQMSAIITAYNAHTHISNGAGVPTNTTSTPV